MGQNFVTTYKGKRVLLTLNADEYTVKGAGAEELCHELLESDGATNTNWNSDTQSFQIKKSELEALMPHQLKPQQISAA
jgi:hypothetical protein